MLDALQLGWRPCAVGAELLRGQLPFLEDEVAARRRNAQTLREALAIALAVIMPPEIAGAEGCYHLLSLVMDPEFCPHDKPELLQRLQERGVDVFDYIPKPIHQPRPHQSRRLQRSTGVLA